MAQNTQRLRLIKWSAYSVSLRLRVFIFAVSFLAAFFIPLFIKKQEDEFEDFMTKNFSLLTLFLMLTSGCAVKERSDTLIVKEDTSDGVICKMQKRVGSNRMTRICFTPDETSQAREAAQSSWQRMRTGSKSGN